MSQQKKLQMMTFIPKNSTINVYTIGFPATWKEKLAELAIAGNASYNYEKYALPLCSALSKLCANWVHGLIEISNMRKYSDDSKWIVCLNKIDKRMCEEICVNLKAAAYSFYDKKKDEVQVQKALKNFIDIIDPEELIKYAGQESVEIIDKNGKIANPYAYNGFCLKLMSSLKGKSIILGGETLTLNYSARNELMSQVLAGPKDLYAYVFTFSLQTIPPDNFPILLLNCSRRRFKNSTKRSKTHLWNKMGVYVKHKGEECYYKLNISYNPEKEMLDWDNADRACYNFTYPSGLPEADKLINAIEKFNAPKNDRQILCVVSPKNSFSSETHIGTGIGVLDKAEIYSSIYLLINDLVDKSQPNDKAVAKSIKLKPVKELYDIRTCLSKTGYKEAKIEIYSYRNNIDLAEKIKFRLLELLSKTDSVPSDFKIKVETAALGDYAEPLSKKGYAKELERTARIRLISERVGRSPENIMTGCIIVLPKNESKEKDAKDLLRCGFALANKVTQFINPEEEEDGENEQGTGCLSKVDNAIYDLLRQFGYSKCPTQFGKLPKYPVIAIGAHSNLYSMSGKKVRALPMLLKFNTDDRMITVESPAINNGLPLPYYKALLEICRLSMSCDCKTICDDAIKRYIELKMKGLENFYRFNDAIVIVEGNGFTRSELWPGISNKYISTYNFSEKYCADSVDIGSKTLSVPLNLNNSKLRVVRIRSNEEIPDYYFTDDQIQTGNADGFYLYHDVYYVSAAEKSKDKSYRIGDKESSISYPKHTYREKKLIEYYPLSLCKNDEPIRIINYINELRGLSPQFNKITNFPLPLHYLDKIKEYFDFDIN